MSQVKSINKENLRIARENIGFTTSGATKKISSSDKRNLVEEWESGQSLPTWIQVSKLAKVYNVSELVFFSEKLINKIKVIPDFRVGVEEADNESVYKLINIIYKRQSWLERNFKAEGFSRNLIQGSGLSLKTPKELARFIAEKLEIDFEKIKSFSGMSSRAKLLEYLIEKAENKGVFVGKTIAHIDIQVNTMRGLFISNDYCPFIVINRKDSLSAQIFSFIHELSHLFRKSDAISNVLEFRDNNSNLNDEEVFCNKVAVEFLLPKEYLLKETYNKDDITEVSDLYKVSPIFAFYRLKSLGKIPRFMQDRLEEEIKAETARNLIEKNKKNQGGNYNNSMKDSNGDLFNRVVSNLYLDNHIGYVEASNLLKFSVEHI